MPRSSKPAQTQESSHQQRSAELCPYNDGSRRTQTLAGLSEHLPHPAATTELWPAPYLPVRGSVESVTAAEVGAIGGKQPEVSALRHIDLRGSTRPYSRYHSGRRGRRRARGTSVHVPRYRPPSCLGVSMFF